MDYLVISSPWRDTMTLYDDTVHYPLYSSDIAGDMPCLPEEIYTEKYLPAGIDPELARDGTIEVAYRILEPSTHTNKWHGMSNTELFRTTFWDLETYQTMLKEEEERVATYVAEHRTWSAICGLTFGSIALFLPKPVPPSSEPKSMFVNRSGVYLWGLQHIIEGLLELVQKERVVVVPKKPEVPDIDTRSLFILYPTPILVSELILGR